MASNGTSIIYKLKRNKQNFYRYGNKHRNILYSPQIRLRFQSSPGVDLLKHKAKQRPANIRHILFKSKLFFLMRGEGLRIMARILIIQKEKHSKRFLFVMRSWVKQYKPRLAIKRLGRSGYGSARK